MPNNQNKWKREDKPNVARFLTFGTYLKKHLFKNPQMCELFLRVLDSRRNLAPFEIWAYVIMPDHIHMILYANEPVSIRKELALIKRQSAFHMLKYLEQNNSKKLDELTDNRGHKRIWQSGGGYDRDLWTPKQILKTIEYIHNNPVRSGFAETRLDYYWSSACAWHDDKREPIRINHESLTT